MVGTVPTRLRTDGRLGPIGIDSPAPAFSWAPPDGSRTQEAFEVDLTSEGAEVWNSGPVLDPCPCRAHYGGPALESRREYHWRVRLWFDGAEQPGEWSEPATFETGILDPTEWQAQWVTGPRPADAKDRAAIYLRGTVDLTAPVVRARAYVTALGWSASSSTAPT